MIGNTIRLEIQQRRPEIEVTKLVGGSNAFVRRPFLYTGIFYGLGGALLAALIVFGGLTYLDQAVGDLSVQYGSRFHLEGLGSRGLGHAGGRRRWPRLAGRADLDRPAPAADRTAGLILRF